MELLDFSNFWSLDGKVAVVHGVTDERSLAYAAAAALVDRGATVALACENAGRIKRAKPLAEALGISVLGECNVTDPDSIAAFYKMIGDEYGEIDIVMHGIAFANPRVLQGRKEADSDDYAKAMEISAFSLTDIMRCAEPRMNEGGSVVALTYFAAQFWHASYDIMADAKAALERRALEHAIQLGVKKKIRVNLVSSGPMKTFSSSVIADMEHAYPIFAALSPLFRNATPAEVGAAIATLCMPCMGGVTGCRLPVNTGIELMAHPYEKRAAAYGEALQNYLDSQRTAGSKTPTADSDALIYDPAKKWR